MADGVSCTGLERRSQSIVAELLEIGAVVSMRLKITPWESGPRLSVGGEREILGKGEPNQQGKRKGRRGKRQIASIPLRGRFPRYSRVDETSVMAVSQAILTKQETVA